VKSGSSVADVGLGMDWLARAARVLGVMPSRATAPTAAAAPVAARRNPRRERSVVLGVVVGVWDVLSEVTAGSFVRLWVRDQLMRWRAAETEAAHDSAAAVGYVD
jgi:hypothetical protein